MADTFDALKEYKFQSEQVVKYLFIRGLNKHIERHRSFFFDLEDNVCSASFFDKDIVEAIGLSISHVEVKSNGITLTFAMTCELANCFNGNIVSISCDMYSWLHSGRLGYTDSGSVEDVHISGLPDNADEVGEILKNLSGFDTMSAFKI